MRISLRRHCLSVLASYRDWVSSFLGQASRFEPCGPESVCDSIGRYEALCRRELPTCHRFSCYSLHPG